MESKKDLDLVNSLTNINAVSLTNSHNMTVKIVANSITDIPKIQTDGSAGYDLLSGESVTIGSNEFKLVKTGIKTAIPKGLYGQIMPRSGLAMKGITCHPGVIDSDYRGTIGVIIYNWSNDPFTINVGDRIAQMVFKKYELVNFVQVDSLDNTDRGTSGFGSTGLRGQSSAS